MANPSVSSSILTENIEEIDQISSLSDCRFYVEQGGEFYRVSKAAVLNKLLEDAGLSLAEGQLCCKVSE